MRTFASCLILCALAQNAAAREIFVSPDGSDASSTATSRNPLRTIEAASRLARAGDTIRLMPGRYSEAIIPQHSGKPGRPIVYRSAGGARRAVLTHARKKGLPIAISITGVSDIVIDGVDVDGVKPGPDAHVDKFARIANATRIVIRNGNFRHANGWQGIAVAGGASYVTLEDNFIDSVGTYDSGKGKNSDVGDAIEIRAYKAEPVPEYVLVQRNRIRHAAHDLLRVSGRYCVIQENDLDNSYRDLLGGNAGGRIGTLIGNDNLLQRNFITSSGISSDSDTQVLFKVEGERNIARQNVFANGFQHGLLSSSGSWSPSTSRFRIYNNTFYKLGAGAWILDSYKGGKAVGDGVFANNAVVDSRLSPKKYDVDLEFLLRVMADGTPTARSIVRGNFFSPSGGGAPKVMLFGFGNTVDLTRAQKRYPEWFTGNRNEAVRFVSANPRRPEDFALRADSPGIDAGVFLTQAVGSGVSNRLKVTDSYYFSDGFGLVPGDTIQPEGSRERARVLSVDHESRTLQLSSAIRFEDGQGVALAYNGAAPDVGAWESGTRRD